VESERGESMGRASVERAWRKYGESVEKVWRECGERVRNACKEQGETERRRREEAENGGEYARGTLSYR
jgi:hypothetical protein